MVQRLLLFLFVFTLFSKIEAQDSIVVYTKRSFKGDRPKIGLVLSGGGAKGIAHVGFLRVMEKAGIHPDYIAGTSMGSIVGALYAIGFSVDSIEAMLYKQNWNEVLSNKLDYRRVNMEEKKSYGDYFAEFPFHGWKPSLPSGAIKGQALELLFEKLTISVVKDTSFDQFYIPYRAVATDLLTGKPYIFKDGSLALAMRSSMSIPTIMQPIDYKGMLLVDGGLVENFPVSVARDMGADIIIGVYTGGQLLPKEDLSSLLAILKQSSLMGGILNAQEQKKHVDIYVEPYLNDMSAADFNSASVFIKRGYDAAMKKLPELQNLAKYMAQFKPTYSKRPQLTDSVFITKADFENIKSKKYKLLAKKILSPKLNAYMQTEDIKGNIDRLYGTRLFKKVGYHFVKSDSTDGAEIVYDVIEREPKHISFGIQYRNETKIGIIFDANFRNVLLPMSKLDLKFRLSEYPAARVRYFTYMGYSTKFGTSISYNLYTNNVPIYNQHVLTAKYTRWVNNISGDISYFPTINSSVNIMGRYEKLNYKKDIDIDFAEMTNLKSSSWVVGLSYELNTYDSKYFTSDGMHLKALAEIAADNEERIYLDTTASDGSDKWNAVITQSVASFLQLSLDFGAYKSLSKSWVMSNELFGVATSLSDVELVQSYLVGGMFPGDPYQVAFWGLPENTNFMNNGLMYRLGFRYEFYDNLFAIAKINGMFLAEDIHGILNSDDEYSYIGNYDNYALGAGLEISYRSLIGPISVGISINDLYSGFWSHIRIGFNF